MTQVDISLLAPPAVVEPLDFEWVLADIKTDLVARYPACAEVLAIESEPLTILLEAFAYREITLRARVNDAAQSVMLAHAVGTDLDQIGAAYDVARLPGEDDARFRGRIQQGYHLLAAAGPANAYRQHALGVSAAIIDVDVRSAAPGQVTVSVLARDEDGALYPTDSPILNAVVSRLNATDVRPLTDYIVVRAPTVIPYTVEAVIEVLPGPDAAVIATRRGAALRAYTDAIGRQIGYDATRAGIIHALVESGVKNIRLSSPAADIGCQHGELAVCTGITLSTEVVDA